MNRKFCLFAGLAAGLVVAGLAVPREALSQLGYLAGVRLQSATPGTQDPGHANVSGTVRAGQFVGGGAGLTSVNADLLDGMNSTAFLQAIPNPLTLSGTSFTHIIRGENASANPSSSGVYGLATSGTGVIGYSTGSGSGVYGRSDATFGIGVSGYASVGTSSSYGLYGRSDSTSGRGVHGYAAASSGTTYGVSGASESTSGRGGHFESFGSAGIGVVGYTFATTGSTYGGFFQSESTSGRGVYGLASATSGLAHGGWFRTASVNGNGVVGQATAVSGNTYGVVGETFSPTGIAVYGSNPSATGWGVYAAGRLGASGAKLFRIDHPHDPENKYLQHYCAEGPEPLNVYSGTVTTDSRGFAAVELPDYFQEINRDPRVQLTVVDEGDPDGFVFVKVVQKVRGNSFRIRTSAPNVEVFWRVEAVRNDLWIQKHGAPVEVTKQGMERGTYQHPELYGMPPERGLHYSAEDGEPKRRR